MDANNIDDDDDADDEGNEEAEAEAEPEPEAEPEAEAEAEAEAPCGVGSLGGDVIKRSYSNQPRARTIKFACGRQGEVCRRR